MCEYHCEMYGNGKLNWALVFTRLQITVTKGNDFAIQYIIKNCGITDTIYQAQWDSEFKWAFT